MPDSKETEFAASVWDLNAVQSVESLVRFWIGGMCSPQSFSAIERRLQEVPWMVPELGFRIGTLAGSKKFKTWGESINVIRN
jgi:hypothetical protein